MCREFVVVLLLLVCTFVYFYLDMGTFIRITKNLPVD